MNGRFILLITIYLINEFLAKENISNQIVVNNDVEYILKYRMKDSGFTDIEEQEIVKQFNEYRNYPYPPAAYMNQLKWNDGLATLAKYWSDKCPTEKYGPENCLHLFNQRIARTNTDIKNVLMLWNSESQDYNYTKNSCEGTCENYKAMMRAEVFAVGCSKSNCKFGSSPMFIMVCNFYPPVYNLTKRPYEIGAPCSRCPNNGKCLPDKNLCEKEFGHVPIELLSTCSEIWLPPNPQIICSTSNAINHQINQIKLKIVYLTVTAVLLLN